MLHCILCFSICSCYHDQPEMKSDSFGNFVSEVYAGSKDSLLVLQQKVDSLILVSSGSDHLDSAYLSIYLDLGKSMDSDSLQWKVARFISSLDNGQIHLIWNRFISLEPTGPNRKGKYILRPTLNIVRESRMGSLLTKLIEDKGYSFSTRFNEYWDVLGSPYENSYGAIRASLVNFNFSDRANRFFLGVGIITQLYNGLLGPELYERHYADQVEIALREVQEYQKVKKLPVQDYRKLLAELNIKR